MTQQLKKAQVVEWLKADQEIMQILQIMASWQLPDCWLVAGTLRNFLWQKLSQLKGPQNDVDVVFFDDSISYEESEALAAQLAASHSEINWEIKNQAWMHRHNFAEEVPYVSSLDAVSKYPETCTALACRLENGQLVFKALWELKDLANFEVRPTPHFSQNEEYLAVYQKRVTAKNWPTFWPDIKIYLT
ncbi:nucleotidyltransferase family protein [Enterococcus asini]|uniref:nucleotidyltransferase family protein n=1 Tax=Enterococcus asini TaxID=57732 RepID=UPI00288D5BA0|nr:nucleotidyltransferase family protein [Enterococcus asini]MDT2757178.1 nucleotidyltransferase family protein [Enterococcus asini]